MRQIILNLDSTDNKLYYQNLIREGENLASELVINLSEEFQGYKYLIKFKNNENLEVVTPELMAVDNQIKYPITNPLTKDAGTLRVELNAFDDAGMLKKTATTTLRVLDALGETDEVVPEAFAPWYIQVFDLVENFTTDEAARVEAENLRETAEIGRGQAYTQAEQVRDGLYQQAEQNRDALYDQAEIDRTTVFNQAEQVRDNAENIRAGFYDGFASSLSNIATEVGTKADKLKVASIEKDLNDYQKTLSQVNINQEAKQKVTGYGVVSLPKNAANGQISDVRILGNSVVDEVTGEVNSTISAGRLVSANVGETEKSYQYYPDCGLLRSVGTAKDEVRAVSGKGELIKRANQVILNGSEGWLLQSINSYGIANFYPVNEALVIPNIAPIINCIYTDKFINQTSIIAATDTDGIYFNKQTVFIRISAAKLTEQTVNGFEAWLQANPVQLTYQLASESVTPIEVSGTLLSYPSGTIYVENAVADAGIYSDKFTILNTDLPIKEIEKISKIDFNTGVETQLDVTKAVINADKKSFTHPSLTANDIVFTTYFYDVESTQGELTVEYYDSRHTLKDSVTGKFYKIVPTVANGVLTNGLVEV